MDKECSHGVEWGMDCLQCELVGLDEAIFNSGKAVALANIRKIEVLALIEEQKQLLNEALSGTM